ncbi:hypothetical protein ACTHQF_00270 [Pedobacter sp. SAFR-022]|uniref:hypothetical protein n=1 Tax=Pedobacter sp. SAFR-022 TaxID=3436861 RepID=UPI003F7EA519
MKQTVFARKPIHKIILWSAYDLKRIKVCTTTNLGEINEDYDFLLFWKFDDPIETSITFLESIVFKLTQFHSKQTNALILLTSTKDQPLYEISYDELIYSFSCSFHACKDFLKSQIDENKCLYSLLTSLFNGETPFTKIFVKEIPLKFEEAEQVNEIDIIIPHKGDFTFLTTLLKFMNESSKLHTYIGLDEDDSINVRNIVDNYPSSFVYEFSPNPVGPYIIRNSLIKEGKSELKCFQDSDDLPCYDRFGALSNFMSANNCDLCGSNEVRVDYFTETVQAIRYPRNVKMALENGPGHALLHPTSIISKKAYQSCGKFSEDKIFANDTQYLLRSFFILDCIMNINEFLYVRRRRPNSLTTAYTTRLNSPVRRKFLKMWNNDFQLIKDNQLLLENTSLQFMGPFVQAKIRKVD